MGHNLEETPDFKNFRLSGNMSTLSFEFEFNGTLHPTMVTEDGAIVLQANYESRSMELNIVTDLKKRLLDAILKGN
jgi:hypothetical protein